MVIYHQDNFYSLTRSGRYARLLILNRDGLFTRFSNGETYMNFELDNQIKHYNNIKAVRIQNSINIKRTNDRWRNANRFLNLSERRTHV